MPERKDARRLRLRFWFDEFTWRHEPLRKWVCIDGVKRAKGFGWRETVALWSRAQHEWPTADDKPGMPFASKDATEHFYSLAAQLELERAEYYRCVEGCCTVIWSNGRNSGGYGPAGCPCDRLKDPRGEKIDA